jgi:adenine-specific DNA-methyltransferase
MTSLAEKERLKGRVQMIYFDPPYGIKFGSNWQVSTRKREVKDAKAEDLTRQPEQIKAFRDTWELGVHSYITYLRDRLTVARELLTESGSLFVQIGDQNVHLVRCVLDEVFGSENFCSAVIVTKTYGLSSPTAKVNVLSTICDYVLWYAKSLEQVKYRQLYVPKRIDEDAAQLLWVEDADGTRRRLTAEEKRSPSALPVERRLFRLDHIISAGWSESLSQPFVWNGQKYKVSANHHWKTTQAGLQNLTRAKRLQDSAGTLRYLRFVEDFPVSPLQNVWDDTGTGQFTERSACTLSKRP